MSRDWRTYSSERGGVTLMTDVLPLELQRAMFIGMDPPRHDRLKNLFQAGIHPAPDRSARTGDPADRRRRARRAGRSHRGRSGERRRRADRLPGDPVVHGCPPEEDAEWARLMNGALPLNDPELNPDRAQTLREQTLPEIFRPCQELIAGRRERPAGDLTSVLVHAEIEDERLTEPEIVVGFFL